jgi:DNA helicase-2/ATP-dependent DNA helicase PcrA
VFSCSKIEQKQLNTWVSFQSAEQPLLGQFSVSGNTPEGSEIVELAKRDD